MTGSARRLPSGRTPIGGRMPVRLTPRTRAVLGARRAALRARPQRPPLLRIVLGIVLAVVLGFGSLATIAFVAATGAVAALSGDLPDPAQLGNLTFSQPTIIYDRTGKVELARFEREQRRVVTYAEVPSLILDATTTAEDRSFWTNDGYDPTAIVAAAVQNASGDGASERGASTITQQLVRARLLPPEVINGDDRYLRKVLEVLQASRLTTAFPGEEGKQKIVTAYLNEIYYGHEAYGIAAAADIYFGVKDLADLTPAQAALLAGLPKAPSVYDPYRYAVKRGNGKLVVPKDSPPVVRRDYVLRGLATSRWTHLTPAELDAALSEDVVLAGPQPTVMRAPHFSWAVRDALIRQLGSLDAVETGGYRVITTLDWKAQQLAERYMYAAAIIPNLSRAKADRALADMNFTRIDKTWIRALRGKDIHNGALVALDYRHGDVLAYVGSASYYREDLASPKFQPQHDAAAAPRQPGSAFKAIVYTTAFEKHVLTPASVLLDISTDFGGGWAPKDADELERGPLLVRGAIQQSLNLPAIRALQRVGNESVATVGEKLGINFLGGHDAFLQAGLAGAIGTVETRPIDLTGAFGAIGNGGVKVPTRLVLSIQGPDGSKVFQAPDKPAGVAAVSPQAAFLTTDILAGNTDPKQNAWWSKTLALRNGPNGERRPAAAKTGTADRRVDFSTYGFLAAPKDTDASAIAVGVWMGNSDASEPRTTIQATSLTTAGQVWHSFLRDYSKDMPVADFKPPKGVVQATADQWSGGQPGPWTRGTVKEWFIRGTEPGAKNAIDQPGLLYSLGCAGWMVDPVKAELGPSSWDDDVAAWVQRARAGAGTLGPLGSRIAYWFGARTWGGPLIGPCAPRREPNHGGGGGGDGNGNGHGHGGGGGGGPQPTATPPPPPPNQEPAQEQPAP
jgi:membrane peptidoglycan carboxypeptidase